MSQLTGSREGGTPPSPGVFTLTGNIDVGGGGPTPVGPDINGNINVVGDDVFTQVQDNAGTNTLDVVLLNSGQGTGTTVGLIDATIFSQPLGAVPGVYEIEVRIAAFNASTPAGFGTKLFGVVRTTGAAGVLISVNDSIVGNEAALESAEATIAVNLSSANSFDVLVGGVAGLTIDWKATAQWTFVS